MVNRYLDQQTHWCEQLGLTPTGVVHFGLGNDYTATGRQQETNYLSKYNEQQNRYNLGMLYENQNLLKNLQLY